MHRGAFAEEGVGLVEEQQAVGDLGASKILCKFFSVSPMYLLTTCDKSMNKRQAINLMISIAEDHDDGISVNLTRLAEECALEFDCADEGGPLDDPTHEIWSWAVDAADHYDRHLREAR